MTDHCGETCFLGHRNGFQSFSQRANLVELDQDRVTDGLLNTTGKNFSVGDKQIVTDQLNSIAKALGQRFPSVPITFVHAVFDGNNRESVTQPCEVFAESVRIESLAFTGQVILAVFVEFTAGAVEC